LGSGKSFLGVMAFLQWVTKPEMENFRGVILRRTMVQVTGPGGPSETGQELYQPFGAQFRVKDSKFVFPNKSTIVCKGCEQEKDKHNFQGWQVSAFLVDEAQQFEESQILYFISRMRTSAPMKPVMMMTANPDYNSYLRVWLEDAGYLDERGLPRKDMDGVTRWFIRQGNKMIWAASAEELQETYGEECGPMSFVFYPANIHDNPVLMQRDKSYVYKLQNLPRVEMERLYLGSWYAKEESSGYFKREWCDKVSLYDQEIVSYCRAWDIAGSLPSETLPNPDWTAGVLLAKTKQGRYIIVDAVRFRARFGEVMQKIIQVAKEDPDGTQIILPQEPGQAGKAAGGMMIKELIEEGFYARMRPSNKSKTIRFQPFAAASEANLIDYVDGKWNDLYFDELEQFDGSRKNKDDF
jgi:predicted phage terminase large subunit-like protein